MSVRQRSKFMKKIGKQLERKVIFVLMMVLLLTMTASAEGYSGDNSLAALGVENGTVTPEFEYSTWEYNVTVAPGTTELILNPVPSDANAQIIDISGTIIGEDGTTTVIITVQAENGDQFPYTLHVTTDQTATPVSQTEEETPQTEEPQTETKAPETENAKIKELETKNKLFRSQADEYKEQSERMVKVICILGLAILILIFVIINQLIRNRDLKRDLKEIENHIDSHNKDKRASFDTYYTPQQGRGIPKNITPVNGESYQEETFRQVENENVEDKAAARKQAKAEKKAAKAEARAAKKAAKYEPQLNNANRQPVQQPRNNMNTPPMNNQMMNNQTMRQPQNNMNGGMMRQPQQSPNGQPMNNQMGGMNNMGPYVGRQPQPGTGANASAGQSRQQSSRESSASPESEHSKVEIDMIDL